MLALAIILCIFLGLGFIALVFAFVAVCTGAYNEIYGDFFEEEQGD